MRVPLLLFTIVWFLFLNACNLSTPKQVEEVTIDTIPLPSLKERGKIIAVTHYNSANYFIYKGRPMGFHYELLVQLTDHLGIPFEVIVEDDLDKNFEDLKKNTIDIIATNLTITDERKEFLTFSTPLTTVNQVLIQRSENNKLVSSLEALAGKRIYVQKGSAFVEELNLISEKLATPLKVLEVNAEAEELIEMVSQGHIGYTVCDNNIAEANLAYFDNLDATIPVSAQQDVAWAISPRDKELKQEIDNWLTEFKETRKYKYLYAKYFVKGKTQELRDSDYYTFNSKRVSSFDEYIKYYSEDIDWDWRLLASVIYQESRFNPDVKSWAGAHGLMQLMPRTAAKFGVDSLSSPKENIRAGVQFLKWLDKRFRYIEDKDERVKFILASYNAGYGHVADAIMLAKKHGKNPEVWEDNVDFFILAKSKPEYYNDPDVKYGYCRGAEPYNYVKQIMNRYQQYQNIDF